MDTRLKTLYALFTILAIVLFMAAVAPMLTPRLGSGAEYFTNYGDYPLAVDKPILYGDYNVKKNPEYSKHGVAYNYVNYPVFPATSCATNNIRYWRRPSNGKCSPPGFCGSLYDNTDQKMDPPPIPPQWDDGIRVNFYDVGEPSCSV